MHFSFRDRSIAFVQRHKLLTLSLGGLCTLTGSLLFTHVNASQPWQWRDLSQTIPSSVQSALTMGAGRPSDWLVSDGTRLWSVNPQEDVASYADEARTRGRVERIGTDGGQYLLAFADESGTRLTQTDLRTWKDLSDLRFPQKHVRSIQGWNGVWGIITEDAFANGDLPRSWQLHLWNGETLTSNLPLPPEVSAFIPGCTQSASGVSVCAGNVAFVPVNGQWYLFAGSAETHDVAGKITQAAHMGVWRWNVDRFETVTNAPQARYVSGVWAEQGHVLVATTNASTDPYAAHAFWTLEGTAFTAFGNEPLEAGLLSVDTRAIHAGWTGTAWAITAGQTLVHMEDDRFAVEGVLRDQTNALLGGPNGYALLIGERKDFLHQTTSTTPALELLGKKLSSNDISLLIRPRSLDQGRLELTQINLLGSPSTNTIKSGETFTFHADARGVNSIRQIEVFMDDARVRVCASATCDYTQTYWDGDTLHSHRRVFFTVRVTDGQGRVTTSPGLVLVVLPETANPPTTSINTSPSLGLMPPGLRWTSDETSGIGTTNWTTPSSNNMFLDTDESRTFNIAALQTSGIRRIEFWVNGQLHRTCSATGAETTICSLTVSGSDTSNSKRLVVTPRILTNDGKELWGQSNTVETR